MPWLFSRSENDAPENHLYFGVELEFAVAHENYTASYKRSLPPWITSDYDCSIHRYADAGIEWRFHPATWLWWCENRRLVKRLLRSLVKLGAESNTDCCCGLHIHFSNVLNQEHLLNIMQFVYSQPTAMQALSRRDNDSMSEYSHLDVYSGGVWVYDDTGAPISSHEQRCAGCRMEISQPIHLRRHDVDIRLAISQDPPSDHYQAVNITPHGTVEVRIFAGTLDTNEFYGSLGFVKTLIDYTATGRGYNPDTDCSVAQYRHWLHHVSAPAVKHIITQQLGRVERV